MTWTPALRPAGHAEMGGIAESGRSVQVTQPRLRKSRAPLEGTRLDPTQDGTACVWSAHVRDCFAANLSFPDPGRHGRATRRHSSSVAMLGETGCQIGCGVQVGACRAARVLNAASCPIKTETDRRTDCGRKIWFDEPSPRWRLVADLLVHLLSCAVKECQSGP